MHLHSSPTHLTPGLLLAEVPRIVLKPDGWGQHSPYGRLLFDFQVSSFKKYSEAELQMLRSEVRGLSIDLHPRIFPFSSLQASRKRPRSSPRTSDGLRGGVGAGPSYHRRGNNRLSCLQMRIKSLFPIRDEVCDQRLATILTDRRRIQSKNI